MTHNLFNTCKTLFNNITNFNTQIKQLEQSCRICFDEIKNFNYDTDQVFFKYHYPFFLKTGLEIQKQFNIVKIRQESLFSKQSFYDQNDNYIILTLLNDLKKIPNSSLDIKKDISKYIHTKKNIYDLFYFYDITNSFEKLYHYIINSENQSVFSNGSMISYYYLFHVIWKYTSTYTPYYNELSKISTTIENKEELEQIIETNIDTILQNNGWEISQKIANILFTKTYSFSEPSPYLITLLTDYIYNNQIHKLNTIYLEFIENIKFDFILRFNNYFNLILNNKLANRIATNLYENKTSTISLTDNSEKRLILNYEKIPLSNYNNKISNKSFQKFYLLNQYFCYNYEKLINIMPIISYSYILDEIKSTTTYNITPHLFKELLMSININNDNTISEIIRVYDTLYMTDIILENDSNILDLAAIITFVETIESFVSTKQFDTTIDEIIYEIGLFLQTNSYLSNNYDYLKDKEYIKTYLTMYFKNEIINNNHYSSFKLLYLEFIDNINQNQDITVPSEQTLFDNLEICENNVIDFDYQQMWKFYESLISNTLTLNHIEEYYNMYK